MNKISKGTINKVVDSGQEGEVVSLGLLSPVSQIWLERKSQQHYHLIELLPFSDIFI